MKIQYTLANYTHDTVSLYIYKMIIFSYKTGHSIITCIMIQRLPCFFFVIVMSANSILLFQMTKRMVKTLEKTRFANCPIVAVAANPGALEQVWQWVYLGVLGLSSLFSRRMLDPQMYKFTQMYKFPSNV